MRTTFRDADLSALLPLWKASFPEPFHIDEGVFRLNTVESPLFDSGASSIEWQDGRPVAFVAIKRSAAGLFRGPDKDHSHLSAIAFEDPSVAVDLLGDAKRVLANRGVNRLIFGQDLRHFFPGCPTNCRHLADFLMIEGFVEGGDQVDVERNLDDYVNPYPAPADVELRVLQTSDMESLGVFLRREFPGRWHYDTFAKIDAEGIGSTIFGMLVDGNAEGFAMIQDASHRVPVGGAVWRTSLGERWGALGPIGISQHLRGGYRGQALLGAALTELKGRGVGNCVIDWTTLTDFYGRHGFVPTRQYQSLTLRLDP